MLSRLLVTLALLAAALIAPAGAPAALTIGMSENNPGMFTDPLFQPLGVKTVRVVMSYNAMTNTSDDGPGDELLRVTDYLNRALSAGIDPLVTFEHARGDWTVCRKDRRAPQCHLPTVAEFERNFRLFRAAFPDVKTFAPWNEGNHPSQPTQRKPAMAAKYTNVVAKNCAGCTLVVMDVLDSAENTASRNPTFKSVTRWIKGFRKALRVPRKICGLHNYGDTNRFRTKGTRTLIKAMGCKQVWLTETGGLYDFASFWSKKTMKGCNSADSCQLKAIKYMFKLTKVARSIKRLYIYTWFGAITPRFDAGLVANGQPRPAYHEVAKAARGGLAAWR
jgi:hypothetical protein